MTTIKHKKAYPSWICYDCGNRYGVWKDGHRRSSTWHTGKCDICGKTCSVTEPRDFGHVTLPEGDLHHGT